MSSIRFELKADSKDSKQALPVPDLLRNYRALAKVIQSNLGDDSHWLFVLKMLNDPENFRPVNAGVLGTSDRKTIFNPKTQKEEKREIIGARGRSKPTLYTKKTATSLLPAHGKMNLFSYSHGVGVLFDRDACKLSDKYIFLKNAFTDQRWWIQGQPAYGDRAAQDKKAVDIKELIKSLDSWWGIIHWNEILARLTKKSLAAVFATKDELTDRLNALHKKFLVLDYLKLDVPVVIITPAAGYKEYTEAQQCADLKLSFEQKPALDSKMIDPLPEINKKFIHQLLEFDAFLLHPLCLKSGLARLSKKAELYFLFHAEKWDAAAELLLKDQNLASENMIDQVTQTLISKMNNAVLLDSKIGSALLANSFSNLLSAIIQKELSEEVSGKIGSDSDWLKYADQTNEYGLGYLANIFYGFNKTKELKELLRSYKVASRSKKSSSWNELNLLNLMFHMPPENLDLWHDLFSLPNVARLLEEKAFEKVDPFDHLISPKGLGLLEFMINSYPKLLAPRSTIILANLLLKRKTTLAKQLLKTDLFFDISIRFVDLNKSLMHYAAEAGDVEVILDLIELGCSCVIKNTNDVTPLDLFYQLPPTDLLKILKAMKRELTPALKSEIAIKLMQISPPAAAEFVEMYPSTNLSATDEKGNTVLHLATQAQTVNLVFAEKLIKQCSDLEVKNSAGLTVFDFIFRNKHKDVLGIILIHYLRKVANERYRSIVENLVLDEDEKLFEVLVAQRQTIGLKNVANFFGDFLNSKTLVEHGYTLQLVSKIKATFYNAKVADSVKFTLTEHSKMGTPIQFLLEQKNVLALRFCVRFFLHDFAPADLEPVCAFLIKIGDDSAEKILELPDFKLQDDSLLSLAIKNEQPNLTIIKKLLELGASLVAFDDKKNCPLDLAMCHRDEKLFPFIIVHSPAKLSQEVLKVFIAKGLQLQRLNSVRVLLTLIDSTYVPIVDALDYVPYCPLNLALIDRMFHLGAAYSQKQVSMLNKEELYSFVENYMAHFKDAARKEILMSAFLTDNFHVAELIANTDPGLVETIMRNALKLQHRGLIGKLIPFSIKYFTPEFKEFLQKTFQRLVWTELENLLTKKAVVADAVSITASAKMTLFSSVQINNLDSKIDSNNPLKLNK